MSKFAILIFFLSSLPSFGQISYGVKVGMNTNKLAPIDLPTTFTDNSKMNIGYHFGLYTLIDLNDKISFKPELIFVNKGANSDGNSIGNPTRININYIELPLILNYNIIEKLALELGPSMAFKVSSSSLDKTTDFKSKNIVQESLDAGITLGLRYLILDNIAITGRYYYGLTSLAETFYVDDNGNDNSFFFQNRNIHFGIEYKLK